MQNNAAKHSRASRIRVSIRLASNRIELAIKDDGTGFEVENQLAADGQTLGLFSMKERAQLSGGSLELRAAPGKGATVLASWPLSPSSPM